MNKETTKVQAKQNKSSNKLPDLVVNDMLSDSVVSRSYKKYAFVIVVCLLVVSLIASIAIIFRTKEDNPAQSNSLPESNTVYAKKADALMQKGVDSNATLDEKKLYFEQVLVTLSAADDTTKTAKFYVQNIAPYNLVFDSDTQDWLISSLIANGYKVEAKNVIQQTIAKLQKDTTTASEAYIPSIQKKIDKYVIMVSNI